MSFPRSAEKIRRHRDRQNLGLAILFTLLIYTLIYCVLSLLDIWRIEEVGQWRGVVQVKIGQPSAPSKQQPELEAITKDSSAESDPIAESHSQKPQVATRPGSADSIMEEDLPVQEKPSQIRGQETGNSYTMEFDGMSGEVGRAGAYEFISSYMPLPQFIDATLFDSFDGYLTMSLKDIEREIEKHWEPFRDEYIRKRGIQGKIPLANRPYYWSLLNNALHYDSANVDWRVANMRPVVIAFKVLPSEGRHGARLMDLEVVSRTHNPLIDEAILYGLSRWVYYNDSKHAIRGQIIYSFEQ